VPKNFNSKIRKIMITDWYGPSDQSNHIKSWEGNSGFM